MKIDIVTLFPDYFPAVLGQSIVGRAVEKKLFEIEIVNLRDYATDRHQTVDDSPFGGGGGMVLKLEPLDRCLSSLGYSARDDSGATRGDEQRIILTSAAGARFDQSRAIQYSLCERLTFICGHYLGVDERLLDLYEVDEVSLGDFILTGGEPAAAALVDAIVRLVPGVLGNFESALGDSHMDDILGAPCYTRPAVYKDLEVPPELLSGDHKEVARSRRRLALRKCLSHRRDLIEKANLSEEDRDLLGETDKSIETE